MSERHKRLAFHTLMVALVLEIVDVTIVNTALPVIESDLGSGAGQVQWVAAGYSLAFALLLMLGGRLGDIVGYRRMFIAGVCGFTGASLLCGMAMSADQLVVARILQGGAGAMMAPQVMAIIQLLYSPRERVSRLALVGVVGGLSAVAGPVVGGLLIQANIWDLGWRSVFLINGPVGLFAAIMAWRLLPENRSDTARGIDAGGTAFFGMAIASLMVPLVRGSDFGWEFWQFALLLASPLLLRFGWRRTARREARDESVSFSPGLFADRQFRLGLGLVISFGAATGGFLFVFAFGVQKLLGFSPLQAGLLHIPFSAGVMLGIAFLGRRLLMIWGKWVMVAGATSMAIGAGLSLAWIVTDLGWAWAIPVIFLAGTGMGTVIGPLTPVVLARVDRNHAGTASGLLKTMQELGMALGVALVGSAFFAGAPDGEIGAIWPAIVMFAALMAISLMLALRLPSELFPPDQPADLPV